MLELSKIIDIFYINGAYMDNLIFNNQYPVCRKCVMMVKRRCVTKQVYPGKSYCMTKIW